MAGVKGGKREMAIPSQFVKLRSVHDMARNVSTFGDLIRPIFAQKNQGGYRLMWPGAKIGECRIVLYCESKEIGNCLLYKPKSEFGEESVEFMAVQPSGPQGGNAQCIPILELKNVPFEEKKPRIDASCIEARDSSQLIKAVITKAMDHETMGKVYVFSYKQARYVAAFGLIDEDELKFLTYSRLDEGGEFCFFRYNYSNDRVEPTNTFGDHSYIYVRVVNLAEPFPFFKPD